MTYSIRELAKRAGVSSRMLRYYEEIQLLTPMRDSNNGYRLYRQQVSRARGCGISICAERKDDFSAVDGSGMIEMEKTTR
ncbi:MerR family DNA-binding transcriptional regulator [Anoxynatronum buryatiense]|uniref:MerR family DNA-binding transcriptional regulator n=1 Tax=Anoxynatronum buryatiense TaxID=489973 RepID=UPI0024B63B2E|nr:MerR family DNA-binding transcriptional regulator [Anoxynatronum buryatiense]